VAAELGARQVCLTAHHSGGFALWPTRASNCSILASPFGASGRDIVREFVDSMRGAGIEPCLYIVLNMDCQEANTTVERYYEIQRDMLTELLTQYGPLSRMWWDMWQLDMGKEWNPGMLWANLTAHTRALAPEMMLLPGPDGCLVGGATGRGAMGTNPPRARSAWTWSLVCGPRRWLPDCPSSPPRELPGACFRARAWAGGSNRPRQRWRQPCAMRSAARPLSW
jgi:hypothetical protein